MNKKQLLVLLAIVALLVYYLNEEAKPKKPKTLLTSKPWIIPPTIKPKTTSVTPPKPETKTSKEPNFPSHELETDYSWLTDDNLEYILKNWKPIQAALQKQNSQSKKFNLRTDIANIYNCFYKAKTSQDWDLPEFLERLEDNKAQYILFPLRVNGNHWGLFILEEILRKPLPEPPMEPTTIYCPPAQVMEIITKVYYTSSGGEDLETEKQQLQPFINQIIGQNTPITIINPKDRKSKGYECGVYLCFYIKEILETGKLELKRTYTEKECQEFRKEWKAKIGESWGRWD